MRLAEGFKSSTQARELHHISRPAPGPPIPQEAVVEVVGGVGTNVSGQPGGVKPGQLRSSRLGSRDTQFIAGEEAADIYFVRGGNAQFEVAKARHEVPLVTKIVIQADNSEVAGLWKGKVGLEPLYVYTITTRLATSGFVR